MAVHTGELRLSTDGDADVIDLTGGVQRIVDGAGTGEGVPIVRADGPACENRAVGGPAW